MHIYDRLRWTLGAHTTATTPAGLVRAWRAASRPRLLDEARPTTRAAAIRAHERVERRSSPAWAALAHARRDGPAEVLRAARAGRPAAAGLGAALARLGWRHGPAVAAVPPRPAWLRRIQRHDHGAAEDWATPTGWTRGVAEVGRSYGYAPPGLAIYRSRALVRAATRRTLQVCLDTGEGPIQDYAATLPAGWAWETDDIGLAVRQVSSGRRYHLSSLPGPGPVAPSLLAEATALIARQIAADAGGASIRLPRGVVALVCRRDSIRAGNCWVGTDRCAAALGRPRWASEDRVRRAAARIGQSARGEAAIREARRRTAEACARGYSLLADVS